MGKLIQIDRSRIQARQECPRMRYWNYHYGGTGLVKQGLSLPLLTGIALHEALAKLLVGHSADEAVNAAITTYADEFVKKDLFKDPEMMFLYQEQCCLLSGLVRGWNVVRKPLVLEEYEVLWHDGKPFVEQEFVFPLDEGVNAMLRMDVVLRHRDTQQLSIKDWKSVSYVSDDWQKQFEHSAQTYLYPMALEHHLRQPVEGIGYEGLVKGIRKTESAKGSKFLGKKLQGSPFCYGYSCGNDYQPVYTNKKGYTKFAVWEAMGTKDWFEDYLLPRHEESGFLNDYFSYVPTISPVRREQERWRKQTLYQEYLLASYLEELDGAMGDGHFNDLRDLYFPLSEGRCFKYGVEHQCQFTELCYNEDAERNPLESGFDTRVPHHDTEEAA